MKKIMTFLLLAITLIACEGPRGLDGLDGRNGLNGEKGEKGDSGEGGVNWYKATFVIKPNDWKLMGQPSELNSYFYIDKPLDALTQFVFDEGTILGYIEPNPDIKNGLPYVIHKGAEDAQGEFFWTQTYDFDFYKGGVRFYLSYSDFSTRISPTENETFQVMLMW